jgi:hypothetical protein
MGKRLLPSNRNPVPGHQGQQAGHATKTTNASKHQAGSHKPAEQNPSRRHPAAEAQAEQHQGASGDLNLAHQRQGGVVEPVQGQSSLLPGGDAAIEIGLGTAATAVAYQYQGTLTLPSM